MSQPTRVPLLVAGVCLILGSFIVSAQEKKKDPPGKREARVLKVGVVDIGVLFKSYKRKDSLEEKINERRKAMTEELKKEAEHEQSLEELKQSQISDHTKLKKQYGADLVLSDKSGFYYILEAIIDAEFEDILE